MNSIEQLFYYYFHSPEEGEEGEYLSPIQILEHLPHQGTGNKVEVALTPSDEY